MQTARPLLVDFDRLRSECAEMQTQLANAEQTVTSATALHEQALLNQANAETQVQQAEQQKSAVEQEIVQARSLDAQIQTLQPQHQKQQQDTLAAGQQLADVRRKYHDTQQNQQQVTGELVQCQTWLNQHQHWLILSEQWPRWDTLFRQGKTLNGEMHTARSVLTQSESALAQAEAASQTARHALDALLPQLSAAELQWQTADAEAKGFDTDALTHASERQQRRLSQLRQADTVWRELSWLKSEVDHQTTTLQTVSAQQHQATAALQDVETALPRLIASHEQAAKMLDLAKLACSERVEALRAQLKPDTECPVCGATQHPFAEHDHPLRHELQALEREVEACRQRWQQAENDRQGWQLDIAHCDQTIQATHDLLATLSRQVESQQQSWLIAATALCIADVPDEGITAWLAQETLATEQALQGVGETLKAMSAVMKVRDQTYAKLEQLKSQQQSLQQQWEQAKVDRLSADQALVTAREKRQTLALKLEHILDELDGAFDDSSWRQAWQTDAEGFYQTCLQNAQAWHNHHQQQAQLSQKLSILQTELQALQGQVAQAEQRQAEADAAFAAIDAELVAKQQLRQGLLNGRSVTEVEQALVKTVNDAKAKLQSAVAAVQDAATKLATARGAVSQITQSLTARQTALHAADAAVSSWLQTFNAAHPNRAALVLDDLREHLRKDAAWLQREREVLQQLDQTMMQAQTVLAERRAQSEQQLQLRRSLESFESLEIQLVDLTEHLKALTKQLSDLHLQGRLDDERRQACAGLQTQIAAQTAVNDTWAKLSSLIGSADGKRFRNIAQQLTLDILLGYANQHLKDLSRRYRLERVNDNLALQVVDQDMGDEIRSVHSLSGGESFLLSLALALGLASLSSNRVRVESLFIDEGFGSLDADTLRVAMDALDSLQAMGRKVGVISHVQDMTERIGTRIEVKRVGSGLSKIRVV